MPEIEEKLIAFENCFNRFMKTDEIIFMLLTSQGGKLNYENLAVMEVKVDELNDEILSNVFDKVQEDLKSLGLYQPLHSGSYYGFLQRLGALLNEETEHARDADNALREAIGLQSSVVFPNVINKNDRQSSLA